MGSTPDALFSDTAALDRIMADHRGSARLVVEASTGAVAPTLELAPH